MFGLCAEGMSSATFPRIMGPTKASRLLMFNETFSAEEAYTAGLVSTLVPAQKFEETAKKLLTAYSTYSYQVHFDLYKSVRKSIKRCFRACSRPND